MSPIFSIGQIYNLNFITITIFNTAKSILLRYILVFFLFFSYFNAFATVEYLTINHITKELYWAETGGGNGEGFIGWEVIPERSHHDDLQKYLDLGYTYTRFPYKLDILAGLIVLFPPILLIIRRKKKRHS